MKSRVEFFDQWGLGATLAGFLVLVGVAMGSLIVPSESMAVSKTHGQEQAIQGVAKAPDQIKQVGQ